MAVAIAFRDKGDRDRIFRLEVYAKPGRLKGYKFDSQIKVLYAVGSDRRLWLSIKADEVVKLGVDGGGFTVALHTSYKGATSLLFFGTITQWGQPDEDGFRLADCTPIDITKYIDPNKAWQQGLQ